MDAFDIARSVPAMVLLFDQRKDTWFQSLAATLTRQSAAEVFQVAPQMKHVERQTCRIATCALFPL
jgi:hypothetical protein